MFKVRRMLQILQNFPTSLSEYKNVFLFAQQLVTAFVVCVKVALANLGTRQKTQTRTKELLWQNGPCRKLLSKLEIFLILEIT